MYFAFDEDQEEFRASLRRLLSLRCSTDKVREIAQTGRYDARTWEELTTGMGVPGLHISEDLGGGGFSFLETAIVAQELGRTLAPVPFTTTVGAMEAVLRLGDPDVVAEFVPQLASGEKIGALAVTAVADLDPVTARVRVEAGSQAQVTGRLDYVSFAHVADLLVVPAVDTDGVVALYVVDAEAAGVVVTPLVSTDITAPVATVELSCAPARLLGADRKSVDRVVNVVRTLLANEALGAAEAVLAMAVDYAKQRVQFNRVIGSFQAIKHKCADMAIAIDAVQATVMYASLAADLDSDEFGTTALIAKAQASDCLTLCANQNIQVHGGIGFTWEADPHLYFRRAKALEPYLGNSGQHRAALADLVGI